MTRNVFISENLFVDMKKEFKVKGNEDRMDENLWHLVEFTIMGTNETMTSEKNCNLSV